jgi:GT2 family glycosyltransferase
MNARNVSALLESLAAQTASCEVLIVDNGSEGRNVSKACEAHSFARAITLDSNAGYSKAVNLAAREASGEALVLLNDDSVCEPEFVEEIVRALDEASGVAMACGVMLDPKADGLIDTAGIEIDRTLLAFDYLNGEPAKILESDVADPLGPSGAAAAYLKDAFWEAGGFDEQIFAYWEDVDLALSLGTLGYKCALASRAIGTHAHSATLGSGSPRKNYLMGFGRGYVLKKWGALSAARLPALLARELPICAGQVFFDRNAQGFRGRGAGLRAPVAAKPYPAELIAAAPGRSLAGTLRKRLERRRRLRG